MREIAFDESGNSGQNLLDPAQPVYVLASLDVGETEAERLIVRLVQECGSAELKFSELRAQERGRELVGELLGSETVRGNARAVPVLKEWMVAGKLVDTFLEPKAANSNALYASGMHRKIADAFYAQGPGEVGRRSGVSCSDPSWRPCAPRATKTRRSRSRTRSARPRRTPAKAPSGFCSTWCRTIRGSWPR